MMSKALDTIERLLKEAGKNRAEIERLTAALKKQTERAEAAEAKLRRYEGGSAAGMLDRS